MICIWTLNMKYYMDIDSEEPEERQGLWVGPDGGVVDE